MKFKSASAKRDKTIKPFKLIEIILMDNCPIKYLGSVFSSYNRGIQSLLFLKEVHKHPQYVDPVFRSGNGA